MGVEANPVVITLLNHRQLTLLSQDMVRIIAIGHGW